MTFEGQYLTYAEYQELGGSAIGEMPFNLLEFEARRKIDIRTQNRLKDNEIPQEVKLCELKMINSILGYNETQNDVSNNGNVASENTDGYSVSYITADKIKDVISSREEELNTIMYDYLIGVIVNDEHIMYVGV